MRTSILCLVVLVAAAACESSPAARDEAPRARVAAPRPSAPPEPTPPAPELGPSIQQARYKLGLAHRRAQARLPIKVVGPVAVDPSYNGGTHAHGGPGLTKTRATINLRSLDGAPHLVRVASLALARRYRRGAPYSKPKTLRINDVRFRHRDDDTVLARGRSHTVAKPTRVEVEFAPAITVHSHTGYAFWVHLEVDGQHRGRAELPMVVKGRSPRRPTR